MPQPRLAGGDGGRGAAHVAEDQQGEQREARERDRDERNDAADDLRARLLRRPGEAGDRLGRVGRSDSKTYSSLAGGCVVEHAQVAQLQPRGDLGQHVVVDQFDADHDRALCSTSAASRRRRRSRPRPRSRAGSRKVCRRAAAAVALLRSIAARVGSSACRRHRASPPLAHDDRASASRSGRTELNQFGSTPRLPSDA